MSNINLKYKFVDSSTTKEKVLNQLNMLCSKKHKVYAAIYDFSLGNNISKYFDDGEIQKTYEDKNVIIKVHKKDYEDHNTTDEQQLIRDDIIQFSDTIASIALLDRMTFNEGALDSINFDLFNDKDYGGLYTDYTIDGMECFLPSHPLPVKIPIPTIFWSTAVFIRNIGRDDIVSSIFNTSKILHIPKFLYTIEHKDEEENIQTSK